MHSPSNTSRMILLAIRVYENIRICVKNEGEWTPGVSLGRPGCECLQPEIDRTRLLDEHPSDGELLRYPAYTAKRVAHEWT